MLPSAVTTQKGLLDVPNPAAGTKESRQESVADDVSMYSRLSLGALGVKTQESANPRVGTIPRKAPAPKAASSKKNQEAVADFLEGGDLKVEVSLNAKAKRVPRGPLEKPMSAMA